MRIAPQPVPQTDFFQTPADIAIIGGSVFGGKTWSLTAEPLRHVETAGLTIVRKDAMIKSF